VFEKVEGLGETPRNTSTKLLFSLCFIYYDICFLILFSCQVEKVGGLGGTPRNTGSSYCFLCALLIMIFASVFLLYFREVLNDCVFLIFFLSLFIFHFIILLCNRDYNLQSNHFRLSGDEACGTQEYYSLVAREISQQDLAKQQPEKVA
jgi:hypothetical protein